MTFKEVQLQDILDIQWGDTKTTKASYVSDGYLAYSAKGPDGFLEKFDYDREGIVLSAIGANCGSTFFASGKWSCIKNTIRILPKSGAIDLKYFFYMTKAPNFWPIRGSAQPFISQTDIRELYVQIPEISVQNIIGKILFELEQKISTNSALSKTLEDISQTIFKSWFIDFDPVKAKMAGEKPAGMDAATAALFPDAMEESELGLIPKGWKISSVGTFCPFKYGRALPASNRLPGTVPVYGSNGVVGNHNEALTSAPSIVIGRKGTVGTVNLEPAPCWIIDTAFYASTTVPKDIYLAYLQLKTLGLNEMNSDGAVPGLNRDNAHRHVFAIGTYEMRETFAELAHNLFTKIAYCQAENRSLIGIRDSLLPRLISGELQIPEEMLAS